MFSLRNILLLVLALFFATGTALYIKTECLGGARGFARRHILKAQ